MTPGFKGENVFVDSFISSKDWQRFAFFLLVRVASLNKSELSSKIWYMK